MDDSEISVYEGDEADVLDALEEEEDLDKKQYTQEQLFDPEELEPTELEELFPDAPYTVYYQETD